MIFGELTIGTNALHTHNDSYVLQSVSAVSTRRPFLSSAAAVSAFLMLFGVGFADILYPQELLALAISVGVALTLGFTIGQLRLVSRDLRGSPIADAVYGTYRHLNRLRPQIADAVERAKAGGAS